MYFTNRCNQKPYDFIVLSRNHWFTFKHFLFWDNFWPYFEIIFDLCLDKVLWVCLPFISIILWPTLTPPFSAMPPLISEQIIPFWTENPSWCLKSGLFMITVTTGGHETIFILTQRSGFTPFITLLVSQIKFFAKILLHM